MSSMLWCPNAQQNQIHGSRVQICNFYLLNLILDIYVNMVARRRLSGASKWPFICHADIWTLFIQYSVVGCVIRLWITGIGQYLVDHGQLMLINTKDEFQWSTAEFYNSSGISMATIRWRHNKSGMRAGRPIRCPLLIAVQTRYRWWFNTTDNWKSEGSTWPFISYFGGSMRSVPPPIEQNEHFIVHVNWLLLQSGDKDSIFFLRLHERKIHIFYCQNFRL